MNKEKLVEDFLQEGNIFAVVGVSRNPEKYGYRVWKGLKSSGYKAYPVNSNASEIDGERCYDSILELPEKPDVVDLVVPPSVTETVVKQCKQLGVDKVWMQPGSESQEAINYCEKNGIQVLSKICVVQGGLGETI